MSFAKNLCKLIEKEKLSSYKLAQDIGVHTSTITNWRNGSTPQINHVKAVAEYFGVSVDDLLSNQTTT